MKRVLVKTFVVSTAEDALLRAVAERMRRGQGDTLRVLVAEAADRMNVRPALTTGQQPQTSAD